MGWDYLEEIYTIDKELEKIIDKFVNQIEDIKDKERLASELFHKIRPVFEYTTQELICYENQERKLKKEN